MSSISKASAAILVRAAMQARNKAKRPMPRQLYWYCDYNVYLFIYFVYHSGFSVISRQPRTQRAREVLEWPPRLPGSSIREDKCTYAHTHYMGKGMAGDNIRLALFLFSAQRAFTSSRVLRSFSPN